MTEIYCVKCRASTSTKSEKVVTTANGRYRLTGICVKCGTKKGMFTNSKGKVTKTPEQLEEARNMRIHSSLKKKAEKIGWKILANPDAEECIKKCLASAKKN